MRHFINTNAAELSLARSVSLLSPMTARPFGALVVGTRRTDEFFFHHDGTVEPFSGAAGFAARVTIGPVIVQPPTFQVVASTAIVGPPAGWSVELDLDDPALVLLLAETGALIGDFFQCSTMLTVEVLEAGVFATVYLQTPITLRALNYSATGGGPGSTALLRPAFYSVPAVTGLASLVLDPVKLGGLATARNQFAAGSTVQLLFVDNVVVLFTRIESTEDENVPWLVRPFDYDEGTNPYQWRIDRVTRDGQPCTYNPETGKWHYLVASGPADAVTIGADQTGVSLPA